MISIVIKVHQCCECPFCNSDGEQGADQCNLGGFVDEDTAVPLPNEGILENCPLKSMAVKVKLNRNNDER